MRLHVPLRAAVAAALLLGLAAAAPAADLDKYLPDDAQMVAVVNVKQVTSWTPFQKQFQDQVQQLLMNRPPAEILKDTGFDPLHDVDRVIIVAAASSIKVVMPPKNIAPPPVLQATPIKPPPGANPPAANPPAGAAAPPAAVVPPPPPTISSSTAVGLAGFTTFILVQGKFDAEKLDAKAKQAAKDHPDLVKSRKVGDADLWEVTPPGPPNEPHIYLALLDKGTLMASMVEGQALEALDKAAGKTKTDLKDQQVRDAVAKLDAKAALQVVASGDLVTSFSWKSDNKGGVTTTTHTLRDDGIEGIGATVTLGVADLHGEATIRAKDADKAKEMAKDMNDGLDKAVQNITKAAQQMKDLQPAVDAMKTIKITASGATISVEGSAAPDAVLAGVKAYFYPIYGPNGPPPPVEVRPVPPPPPPAPIKDK